MASTLFTGASRYSTDFSAVIERSVGIASLSLTQMQQSRAKSGDEVTALKAIESRVVALQSTIKGIEDSVAARAWQASSSDAASVKVATSDGAAAGSYTVNITSLGSYSISVGKTAVADPSTGNFVAAGTTKLTLRVTDHDQGGSSSDITIDVAGTTLQAVVDAINAKPDTGVQAAVVNTSETATPAYAISLQARTLGKLALQLKEGSPPPVDDSKDLMRVDEADAEDASLGARTSFSVNKVALSSASRTITLAPKLTVDLLKADGKEITVRVERNTSAFSSGVESFVSAYNNVIAEIDKYTGSGGALAGNALAATIRNQLRSAVTAVLGSGQFTTLAQIGVEYTKDGRLSFNTSLFATETRDKFDALQTLVGTSSTGGFAKILTDALNTLEAANGGMLKSSISSLDAALKSEDQRIAAEQTRVEQFTRDLQERLAKADAAIAALEQQASYFNSMFEAMRVNQKSMS